MEMEDSRKKAEESIRKKFQQLGYRAAPVVKSDAGDWVGFQPNKIKEMGTRFSKK